MELVEGLDKQVVDHIEAKDCGKSSIDGMLFHEEHHKLYRYIMDQIYQEFRVVARNYVDGTPDKFRVGSVWWEDVVEGEAAENWTELKDMLTSPVTILDATNIIFKSDERETYNQMILDGDAEGILSEINKRKGTVEDKLVGVSGDERDYHQNELVFYVYAMAEARPKMGLGDVPAESIVAPAVINDIAGTAGSFAAGTVDRDSTDIV